MAVHTTPAAADTNSSKAHQVRASIVDWMASTAAKLQLPLPALFLGVRLLDRLLAAPGLQQLGQPKVGLAACACLAIASKFEQACSPPLRAYLPLLSAGVTLDQLKAAELMVLSAAGFRLQGLSEDHVQQHLGAILQRLAAAGTPRPWQAAVSHLAHYLSEVTLLEAHLVPVPPRQVAAACLAHAMAILGTPMSDTWLSKLSGFKLQQLEAPIAWIAAVHATLCAAAHNGRPYAPTRKYLPGLCGVPVAGSVPGVLWACPLP
jgi:hypothetical protein